MNARVAMKLFSVGLWILFCAAGSFAQSATFVKMDGTTQGTWQGSYGSDGQVIALGTQHSPSYATVNVANAFTWNWDPGTSDVRALQFSSGRQATCFYNNPGFSININITDGNTHQLAAYGVDWDSSARGATLTISDTATGTKLDSRSLSGYHNGIYLVWNVSGNVTLTFTDTAGANAVLSGLFFDTNGGPPPPPPAHYVVVGTIPPAGTGSPITSANFYRAGSATGTLIKIGSSSTLTNGSYYFNDTGVTAGATYYYAVTYVSENGESAPNGRIPVTIPSP
jgi:hypothetical protein